jgi:hypothetical protein
MTDLSRSLLNAAREGLAPGADVAARVRAKVAAAVTVPAATPVAAPVSAPGSSSLLLKLGAALLAVGVVATVLVATPERAPEAPLVSVTSHDGDDAPEHVHVAAPNDPLVIPDAPARRGKHAVAPAVVATPALADPSTDRASIERAPVEREPATLSREVELIDLAMTSLRKNAPLVALEAIRAFEHETLGKGQMAEEAAAIEIEARCVLREDVTDALARFDRKWPESAQRERIQTACFARQPSRR